MGYSAHKKASWPEPQAVGVPLLLEVLWALDRDATANDPRSIAFELERLAPHDSLIASMRGMFLKVTSTGSVHDRVLTMTRVGAITERI